MAIVGFEPTPPGIEPSVSTVNRLFYATNYTKWPKGAEAPEGFLRIPTNTYSNVDVPIGNANDGLQSRHYSFLAIVHEADRLFIVGFPTFIYVWLWNTHRKRLSLERNASFSEPNQESYNE